MSRKKPVAVVTGAGSGIGRAVAMALLGADYHVVLAGRRESELHKTLGVHGAAGLVVPTDVTRESSVQALFRQAEERFGGIDLFFNNAGIFGPASPFEGLSLADWQRVVDTNLTGAFLGAREAFAAMKRRGGGRIINNGSISAQVPRPHAAAYTATKHAITGLTKAISLEGRTYGIACGQIDVGNAATEMTHGFGKGALQADGSVVPEPQIGVREVADAVLYMAGLPLNANVQFMTLLATNMPFIGRG